MKFIRFLAVACLICSAPVAEAAVSYELFFVGPGFPDSNNAIVPVAPGAFFNDVEIFLRERLTLGSPSLLAAQNVIGYNLRVVQTGAGGGFSDLRADPTGGTAGTGLPADRFEFSSLAGSKPDAVGGDGFFQTRLGFFDLTAPNVGQTQFSIVLNNGNDGDLGLELIDVGNLFTGGSITLVAPAAIPEPSTMVVLAVGAGVVAVRRRRAMAKLAETSRS